ncbi:MAG: hypothetical protein JW965_09855 [Bacteroidales bacterium]|nr:hypothetical protein [Bacteroidales bacterium]
MKKIKQLYRLLRILFLVNLVLFFLAPVHGQDKSFILANNEVKGEIASYGIIYLTDPADPYHADIIRDRPWGVSRLIYRTGDSGWIDFHHDSTRIIKGDKTEVTILASNNDSLSMKQVYRLHKDAVDLDIIISTGLDQPVTIGDLALGLPWRRPSGEEPEYIFEECFTKHHFISGHGSFLYFTRPSGEGPFVMVLPKKGTKLEYFDNRNRQYNAYIFSELSGNEVVSGTWRQEHTGIELLPGNRSVSYGFRFRWADSWDDMRDILYEEGLFDIRVVPGMTIPSDLKAQFSLHTKNDIQSITAEFPDETEIRFIGEKQPDHFVYEVKFNKLGENMLTINYGEGAKTYLEFFSTEPVETMLRKRASFLVNSQQHRDTSKWYDGLFSVYDMKNSVLRGPDNTDGFDGWWGYVLACDDPALCKAPFLAAKNVYYPDDEELKAVEYYLENFVWNGLQRTDKDDPYPYGIYGVPNWKEARDWKPREPDTTGKEILHVWRSYDYPHIVMLYYHMYQIAKMYPEKVDYLDAGGYLERAYQTARAYFRYPYDILPYYDTYKWGCYNELVIEKLINDLMEEGRNKDAEWLRTEYEKKVKYAIYDDKYPFRSEYAIDRTAFESSYAFARYGSLHEMEPDTNSWYDRNKKIWRSHPVVRRSDARDFMDRQHYAGLAVRGWLESKYFLLGSDFTSSSDNHCLSYMSMMGGRSILDYGVHFADEPHDWLQLGYASYLSSWSLMNTGTEESDYGYWAPGKENDGAVGWAFMESKHGRAWIRKQVDRGAWFYDGEIDLGLGATTRTARTVLTYDPLFGWISYGGILERDSEGFSIIPKDGVRNRFALVTDDLRAQVELNRDGFRKDDIITVNKELSSISFIIENRYGKPHNTRIYVENYQGLIPKLNVGGREISMQKVIDGNWMADIKVSVDNTVVSLGFKK